MTQNSVRALNDTGFANTRWSLVAALRNVSGAEARRSLNELCQSYWYPVYAYVRRCGHEPQAAYDLSRRFFGHLLEALRQTDPTAYGKFRQFLMGQLHRFLAQDADARAALDDAAPVPPVSLAELEARQRRDHAPDAPPEHAFQRSFALEVVARALGRLRREAMESGREAMFVALEAHITADPDAGRTEHLARELGTSALAVRIAIRRLRQRFRELVDDELAQTVVSAAELATERQAMLGLFGGER